ncbi:hypothetical protein JB92DRAFT_3126769 [Gautieria morchelliformis]|nr:hypothetical protein JB92DRAFT_3126769 [Gautieria morchelliformis]
MALSVTAADGSPQGVRGDSSQASHATDGLDWPERQGGHTSWPMSPGRRMDATVIGKSSAVRRHFAQFERHQLDEVNDEIELGWNCGICRETAEDPCVTRCGHLYCRSHLSGWLSKRPSCPVCNDLCTPTEDIVPIFSREQSSLSSSNSSPSLTPTQISRSPSPSNAFESPTIVKPQPWRHIPSPPNLSRTRISYHLAYYLGIVLRVIGLALLLSVLLPGGFFARSPSASHPVS